MKGKAENSFNDLYSKPEPYTDNYQPATLNIKH
ncbi:hypothetical protein J2783_004342 [Chryseobacterium sediminis]|nr:hypothetical protein [Chryseobacterium sediminis]